MCIWDHEIGDRMRTNVIWHHVFRYPTSANGLVSWRIVYDDTKHFDYTNRHEILFNMVFLSITKQTILQCSVRTIFYLHIWNSEFHDAWFYSTGEPGNQPTSSAFAHQNRAGMFRVLGRVTLVVRERALSFQFYFSLKKHQLKRVILCLISTKFLAEHRYTGSLTTSNFRSTLLLQ